MYILYSPQNPLLYQGFMLSFPKNSEEQEICQY